VTTVFAPVAASPEIETDVLCALAAAPAAVAGAPRVPAPPVSAEFALPGVPAAAWLTWGRPERRMSPVLIFTKRIAGESSELIAIWPDSIWTTSADLLDRTSMRPSSRERVTESGCTETLN
jgi:hypothetical protein